MKLLQTQHEKRAFAITTAVFALLFLLFVFYKIKNEVKEAPFLGGEIAINFGNSQVGKGEVQPTEAVEMAPQPERVVAAPPVEKKIVTQKNQAAPVVKSAEKPVPKKEVSNAVKPQEKPKPNQATTDALSSLIQGPKSTGAQAGHGDDATGGDKGKLSGDLYSNSFYGSGRGEGSGGGTSWGLNGRALASSGKVVPDCNEQGTVVVQIRVDRSGKVISAQHTKGTTNSSKCLTDAAIATARTFRWKPDSNAPENQVGFIVINFRVGA